MTSGGGGMTKTKKMLMTPVSSMKSGTSMICPGFSFLIAGQKLSAILGAPDKVVADVEYGFIACYPTSVHVDILIQYNTIGKQIMINTCFHPTTKVSWFSRSGIVTFSRNLSS